MVSIYPDPKDFPAIPQPSSLPPSPPAPNLFERIFSAISRAFASLFQQISQLFHCFSFPEDKDIQPPSPPVADPALLNDREIISLSPSATTNSDIENKSQKVEPPTYIAFDPTLEELRQAIRDFVQLTIDVVHEKQITPHIVKAQEAAPSIPPAIKSITKLLVEMGDKAAKPLFQKIANQKAETVDPALKKILTMLLKVDNVEFRTHLFNYLQNEMPKEPLPKGQKALDYLKPVIDWICLPDLQKQPISTLLGNGALDGVLINELCAKGLDFYQSYRLTDINQLYSSLEEKLVRELKELQIPNDQDLSKDYIKPILDWLIRSDQSEPIASLFIPKALYDDNLIDKTFELAITYIVEHNIDQYANRLDNLLQHQLQKIVYNTIQTNAQAVTDFLTQRVAELVTELPFTETFDNIVQDVINHVETCAEAEEAASNSVFPQDVYLKKFSQNKTCNTFAKQMMQQQALLTSQGKDPNNVRKAIEKAFFTHLTDKLFHLMFPTKKKLTTDGNVEEIDPFIDLWQRLSFPEELHSFSQKIEEITQEFITPDTRSLFSSIKQPTLEILRTIFKTTTQDLFKKQLASLFQNAFENLTLPKKVDALMAESIFPALNKQLLSIIVQQEFSQKMPILIPYFHKWIKEGSQNSQAHIQAIQNVFIPLAKERFQEFSESKFHVTETISEGTPLLAYKPFSAEDWQVLTQGIIENTERHLLKSLRDDPLFSVSMPTEIELLALYEKEPQKTPVTPNPAYGELVTNLIFKIGTWPDYLGMSSFIKGLVSTKVTESLEEIRVSHDFFVKLIANVVSEQFADREKIAKLLYAPASPGFSQIDQKLQCEIDTLSRLAHDLIMNNTEGQYKIVKFGIKKYLKEDSSAIRDLVSDIYKKMFSRHLVTENLLMNVCEKFFKGLQEADEALKQQQELNLHLSI